jgi:hypothetical protein
MPLGRSKHAPSATDAALMEEVRQAAVHGDSDTVVRLMGEGVKLEPDEVRSFFYTFMIFKIEEVIHSSFGSHFIISGQFTRLCGL